MQEALDRVTKNRSVIVIAHRLSTVMGADVIAVVSNGEIAEMGTHGELKNKKGLYYDLIRRQDEQDKGDREGGAAVG